MVLQFDDSVKVNLETKGWVVIPGVVSESDCDQYQSFYTDWLSKFKEWPTTWANSWIGRFKSGHTLPAWDVRLKSKPVFSHIWSTDNLLCSMDAIAIGRPPESYPEVFSSPNLIKFRSDQTAEREGLHGYQGMVHLEACDTDDWTYEVIEGSHNYFDEFMDETDQWYCPQLQPEHIDWFKNKGCTRKKLSCPKGGILLCDARLFRSDARPMEGRKHPGRWRYMIHVCMTPASWATEADLAVKRKAYETLELTRHWPSQKVQLFTFHKTVKGPKDPYPNFTLPDIAKTDEAKRLAGVLPYKDGIDCEFSPSWNMDRWGDEIDDAHSSSLVVNERGYKFMDI